MEEWEVNENVENSYEEEQFSEGQKHYDYM